MRGRKGIYKRKGKRRGFVGEEDERNTCKYRNKRKVLTRKK
jgi:hypothetical protein